MKVTFLLGPAGSGKTFRCLADVRALLQESPTGPPLLFLAPKQATFQLERELLAAPGLAGYTRLQILSFERLAQYVLEHFGAAPLPLLSEEGRVMVLRALLARKAEELSLFRATARLPGFAQQLSALLRELQQHRLAPGRLTELAARLGGGTALEAKLQDVALLLRAYLDWLRENQLEDACSLLDLAADAVRQAASAGEFHLRGLWLDGFAEMTPQELDLLAALAQASDRSTLAFCLEREPREEPSWLSCWTLVGQTYRRCRHALAALPGGEFAVQVLPRHPQTSRFAGSPMLALLEKHWADSIPRAEGAMPPLAETAAPALHRSGQAADLACGPPARPALRVVACANPEAEAVQAAREILRYVRDEGGRFRDVAVLVRSLKNYADVLRRVFTRHGLPFFLDRRESVAHHPLAELSRFALRLAAFGWAHDDWFGALKTGLVHRDDDTIDRLENEALARGWTGSFWRDDIREQPAHTREAWVEALRQQLVPPFARFVEAVTIDRRCPSGPQLVGAFAALWEDLEVAATLERWNAELNALCTPPAHNVAAGRGLSATRLQPSLHLTVWQELNEWLVNLERAFARQALALEEWIGICEAGLANLTAGVIPPALDQVVIGAIDRSRHPDLQMALVLGLNEGVFPAPPPSRPLLSEHEREALAAHGVELGPDVHRQLGHERYYGYIACTRARRELVFTYAQRDASGKELNRSPFLDALQRRFPGLAVESSPVLPDWQQGASADDVLVPLLRHSLFAPTGPTRGMPGFEPLPQWAGTFRRWAAMQAAPTETHLPALVTEHLYGAVLHSSVSALEDYAACPFKFFAGYGLRLKEREQFEADARERGSFQHEVLRRFHEALRAQGQPWRGVTPEAARALLRRVAEALLPEFGNGLFVATQGRRFAAATLMDALEKFIGALMGWMRQYGFDPWVAELGFGSEAGGLPAWELDLGEGHALRLRGRIDRVDLARRTDGREALAVVIDYKTGGQKLEELKLQHGLDLQLLAYLGALRSLAAARPLFQAERVVAAGAFYVGLRSRGRSEATREEADQNPEPTALQAYQHRGRFVAEELRRFDARTGQGRGDQFCYAINKDGSFARRANEALARSDFEALLDLVEGHLRRFGQEIFRGCARVAPFRTGQQTACDYCPYLAVCRFDAWTQRYRVLRPASEGE